MDIYREDQQRSSVVAGIIVVGFIFFVITTTVGVGMWGCPRYKVYEREMAGRAELAQAEFNRRTAVVEAQAKLDAAKLLNQSDIERAKGVAEANRIIGDSLKSNEAYLRYLWIQGLETNEPQVIYVPTEAGLPILEAGRTVQKQNTPAPAPEVK